MQEIEQLFAATKVEEIKKYLKLVIEKIESVNKEQQNDLLEEVVKRAKEVERELKEKYTIVDCVSFFSEDIAPIALLVEEISNDADNHEDILQVLKFNLNNYTSITVIIEQN